MLKRKRQQKKLLNQVKRQKEQVKQQKEQVKRQKEQAKQTKEQPDRVKQLRLHPKKFSLLRRLPSISRKQADGDVIRMVVEITETATLNDKQTGAIEDMNVAKTFEAFIECNGKRVHDFKGGNAIVSIDFVPEKGMNPKNYHVCYIAEDGSTDDKNKCDKLSS